MVIAYIGFGANLGDRAATLAAALASVRQLATDPAAVRPSRLYRSAPVGGPPNQPDYLNGVVQLPVTLTAEALLDALQQLEAAHGRVREVRWGARTLDLDLLLYGEQICDTPRLTLPHPRITQRAFVLYPLLELAPQLQLPDGLPLAQQLAAVADQPLQPVTTSEDWV